MVGCYRDVAGIPAFRCRYLAVYGAQLGRRLDRALARINRVFSTPNTIDPPAAPRRADTVGYPSGPSAQIARNLGGAKLIVAVEGECRCDQFARRRAALDPALRDVCGDPARHRRWRGRFLDLVRSLQARGGHELSRRHLARHSVAMIFMSKKRYGGSLSPEADRSCLLRIRARRRAAPSARGGIMSAKIGRDQTIARGDKRRSLLAALQSAARRDIGEAIEAAMLAHPGRHKIICAIARPALTGLAESGNMAAQSRRPSEAANRSVNAFASHILPGTLTFFGSVDRNRA